MTTTTETITLIEESDGEAYDIEMEVQNPSIGPRLEACIQIKAKVLGYSIIAWFYPTNPPRNTDFSFDLSIDYTNGNGKQHVSFDGWTIGNVWQLSTVGPIKLLEQALMCVAYDEKERYESEDGDSEGRKWSDLTTEQQDFVCSMAREDLSYVVSDMERKQ